MNRVNFLGSVALAAAVPAAPSSPAALSAARAAMPLAGAPHPISPCDWNKQSETVNPNRRTALVLSGGIAQGVYEAGVVKSLLANGYKFDVICGTSIGALNGAMIAQGDHTLLEHTWTTLASKPIKKFERHARLIFDAVGALRTDGLAVGNRYVVPIVEFFLAYDGGKIAALQGVFDPAGAQSVLRPLDLRKIVTPFMFAVTNVNVGQGQAIYAGRPGEDPPKFDEGSDVPVDTLDFSNQDHVSLYPEAVRASGALPLAFAPIPLRGLNTASTVKAPHFFSDGGVANNTPVRLARKLGVTDIICVFMAPRVSAASASTPQTIVDSLLKLYTANQNQLLDDEILLALQNRNSLQRSERNADSVPEKKEDRLINIYEVRPSSDIGVDSLAFDDQAALDYGFMRGVEDGKKYPVPYPPPVSPVVA